MGSPSNRQPPGRARCCNALSARPVRRRAAAPTRASGERGVARRSSRHRRDVHRDHAHARRAIRRRSTPRSDEPLRQRVARPGDEHRVLRLRPRRPRPRVPAPHRDRPPRRHHGVPHLAGPGGHLPDRSRRVRGRSTAGPADDAGGHPQQLRRRRLRHADRRDAAVLAGMSWRREMVVGALGVARTGGDGGGRRNRHPGPRRVRPCPAPCSDCSPAPSWSGSSSSRFGCVADRSVRRDR